jgi:hypothetical protein
MSDVSKLRGDHSGFTPALLQPPSPKVAATTQYSDQCPMSPTFSNSVSLITRRRARSSRPKQQNKRARPLRFRGVRPSYGLSLLGELDVEEGLRGIVALIKMSESRLRYCCVSTSVRGDEVSEYGDGVVVDAFEGKDVVIGESIWRFARGDAGSPYGEDILIVQIGCV